MQLLFHPSTFYKQGISQKTPSLIKGTNLRQNVSAVNSKMPQKSEINHYAKKNIGMPQNQMNKLGSGSILNPTESTQSFKTSPIKNDIFPPKYYPQSITKGSTNKAQKIKIGLHKKAVSLIGNNIGSNNNDAKQCIELTKSFNLQNTGKQTESMKQSLAPSQQTSFYDYQSSNQFQNEIKSFSKPTSDKSGSLLTHQQKQQMINYQQIINKQQLTPNTYNNLVQSDINHSHLANNQGSKNEFIQSFDQRPPLNQQLGQNQSQRVSIISTSGINDTQINNAIPTRSHTNSFSSKSKVVMQHSQNQYVNQQPNTYIHENLIKKKTLQSHHQRTLSDNQQYLGSGSLNMIIQSNGNLYKKQLQDILLGKNDNNDLVMSSIDTHQNLPSQYMPNSLLNNQNAKTTIGSSRQSVHSSRQEEKDIISSQYSKGPKPQKYTDLKNIYNGILRDQITKTKQVLKLTQQQFGGPSRKVVQKFNGHTQSYRASNYGPLTNNNMIFEENTIFKQTPKIDKDQISKVQKVKSQNTSSHGTRSSQNSRMIDQFAIDKVDKKKNATVYCQNKIELINPKSTNISTGGFTLRQSTAEQQQAVHKRSQSDGNQTFVSLSNRINQNQKKLQVQDPQDLNSMLLQDPKTEIYSKQNSVQQIVKGQYVNNIQSNQIDLKNDISSQYNPVKSLQSSGIYKNLVPSHQKKSSQQNSQEQMFIQLKKPSEMNIQDQDMVYYNKFQQVAQEKQYLAQKENIINYQQLKVVEERIETQESNVSDPNLSPRTKMNVKLIKKIKLAFQTTNNPPATSADFYKIGKVMGKGAFGKVNLAIHRISEKFVALKSINRQFLSEETSKRKVMQEFNILRRTRHTNIVRLYESFETQQHIVFVMEICGAGDLLTYVRRRRKLKEDVAKHIFKQIIEGLKYCHSKNILHRDIKLDNILLTSEGDVKICDFGVSKLVKNGEIMTEQCGTPAYIAPEVFENKGYEGYESDIWSAGVVLYAMLYGTVPFKASNMTELQKQITKVQTTFKDEISPESINLLKGILERDPVQRFTAKQILNHPWMQDVNEKVVVFTDQEKEKINSEFAYYQLKNDNNQQANQEIIPTDPFTEQMLNSTQNSLIKNASTKSVILAPFNSTRSNIDENHHLRKSIQDLMIDKKNMKFAAKVKEIDRQYEANNNGELDNGVYHQEDEEETKEKEENEKKKDNKKGSLLMSFDNDHQQDLGDEQIQKEIEDGQQRKKQSEWQKIEQMMIDKQKTEEDEEEKKQFAQNKELVETLVIDEKIINEVEKGGFPKIYVINSLNNDELNYATTFYYLLQTIKEF